VQCASTMERESNTVAKTSSDTMRMAPASSVLRWCACRTSSVMEVAERKRNCTCSLLPVHVRRHPAPLASGSFSASLVAPHVFSTLLRSLLCGCRPRCPLEDRVPLHALRTPQYALRLPAVACYRLHASSRSSLSRLHISLCAQRQQDPELTPTYLATTPDSADLFRYTRSCLGALLETPSLTTLGTAIWCFRSLPYFRTLVDVGLRHNLDIGSNSWYAEGVPLSARTLQASSGGVCGSGDRNMPTHARRRQPG
jgi:hypothetical protein